MKRLILSLCIALNGVSLFALPHATQVRQLAQAILQKGTPSIRSLQEKLSVTLKKVRPAHYKGNPKLLHLCLQASLQKNEQHMLYTFKEPLLFSWSKFVHTPGYLPTLHKILANLQNQNMVKGHAFEIERAVTLNQEGEEVLHFNRRISTGTVRREIDLQTTNRLIECKNINWRNGRRKKLRKQFSDQLLIANHLSLKEKTNYLFEVSSKQQISESWKRWFVQQNISFNESVKA